MHEDSSTQYRFMRSQHGLLGVGPLAGIALGKSGLTGWDGMGSCVVLMFEGWECSVCGGDHVLGFTSLAGTITSFLVRPLIDLHACMSSLKQEKSAGPTNPGTDVKERLLQWGWFTYLSIHRQQAYSEINPNYPEDSKKSKILDSGSFDDDDVYTVNAAENSPYPLAEIRAAVKNYDEDVPANNIRTWIIGMLIVVFGASMNTLSLLRSPSISLGSLIAQIITWSLVHVMDGLKTKVMPKSPFQHDWFEIEMVVESCTVQYQGAFHHCRHVRLSRSYSMIWPANLVSVTLMNAMYKNNEKSDPIVFVGKIHRYRWFAYVKVTAGAFYWDFVPGFLAQFLSVFTFATLIAPNNVVVNQLFGGSTVFRSFH
ncbi:hypothetical protein SBOR_6083 [Sclerotinia borealis F-4128]|uniref:Oligopeptide transporter n=1 Tax=Sclerotinia borealis (strain F-4128) TaxID=1432307 RepID=W9CCF0_SCLBF|nr:hypothetical protein SBOR_6083 [Sclerotinia borealis F-4128]